MLAGTAGTRNTSVKAALIHILRLGGLSIGPFWGGILTTSVSEVQCCRAFKFNNMQALISSVEDGEEKRFAEHFLLRLQHSEVLNSKLS